MQEVKIAPFSIFVGHEDVQHAGAGWRGQHSIRYHTYLSPEEYELPDSIQFAYDTCLKPEEGTDLLLSSKDMKEVQKLEVAGGDGGEVNTGSGPRPVRETCTSEDVLKAGRILTDD